MSEHADDPARVHLTIPVDPDTWPLPLDRVQVIVGHLVNDGSREGLILGNELNFAMGASARRRAAAVRLSPPASQLPG